MTIFRQLLIRRPLGRRSLVVFTLLAVLLAWFVATAETPVPEQAVAVYSRSCIACHGADGAGAMPGIPDLTDSNGPLMKSDTELLKSILDGVETPAAPTPMPARGGDEDLTDAEARLVLQYIRHQFGK